MTITNKSLYRDVTLICWHLLVRNLCEWQFVTLIFVTSKLCLSRSGDYMGRWRCCQLLRVPLNVCVNLINASVTRPQCMKSEETLHREDLTKSEKLEKRKISG